jgi:hypothetical protein
MLGRIEHVLEPKVHGLILREDKNSTSEGVETIVRYNIRISY